MRENIGVYRGKREDNGEWVYGYFGVFKGVSQIFVPFTEEEEKANEGHIFSAIGGLWYTVLPETVGQYTGLNDKNGSKVFEGDIVAHFVNWLGKRVNGVCKYDSNDASYSCYFDIDNEPKCAFLADWVDGNGAEIIGNVWDNPELLQNTVNC